MVKAENISQANLSTAVNAAANNNLETLLLQVGDIATQAQMDLWKAFNTALRNNPLLTKSLVTTYTYKPMTGVTSQTDANGFTSYYNYDEFGRLSNVNDNDNNILKDLEYHYQGGFEVSPGFFNLGYQVGTAIIKTVSAGNFTVTNTQPSWLTATKSGEQLNLSYSENTTVNSRTAILKITSASGEVRAIQVLQAGKATAASITLATSLFIIDFQANSLSLSVSSNVDWEISGLPSWLTTSKNSGPSGNNQTVTLTVLANGEYLPRTSTVVVQSADNSLPAMITFQVNQSEKPITASPASYTFSAAGGSKSFSITHGTAAWTYSATSLNGLTITQQADALVATYTANTIAMERGSSISLFVNGSQVKSTLTLYQSAPNPTLTVTPTSLSFPSAGATQSITITSNINWAIENPNTWITVGANPGTGNATVNITCAYTKAPRIGTISITSPQLASPVVISISQ